MLSDAGLTACMAWSRYPKILRPTTHLTAVTVSSRAVFVFIFMLITVVSMLLFMSPLLFLFMFILVLMFVFLDRVTMFVELAQRYFW